MVYLQNLPNRFYHMSYDAIEEKQMNVETLFYAGNLEKVDYH